MDIEVAQEVVELPPTGESRASNVTDQPAAEAALSVTTEPLVVNEITSSEIKLTETNEFVDAKQDPEITAFPFENNTPLESIELFDESFSNAKSIFQEKKNPSLENISSTVESKPSIDVHVHVLETQSLDDNNCPGETTFMREMKMEVQICEKQNQAKVEEIPMQVTKLMEVEFVQVEMTGEMGDVEEEKSSTAAKPEKSVEAPLSVEVTPAPVANVSSEIKLEVDENFTDEAKTAADLISTSELEPTAEGTIISELNTTREEPTAETNPTVEVQVTAEDPTCTAKSKTDVVENLTSKPKPLVVKQTMNKVNPTAETKTGQEPKARVESKPAEVRKPATETKLVSGAKPDTKSKPTADSKSTLKVKLIAKAKPTEETKLAKTKPNLVKKPAAEDKAVVKSTLAKASSVEKPNIKSKAKPKPVEEKPPKAKEGGCKEDTETKKKRKRRSKRRAKSSTGVPEPPNVTSGAVYQNPPALVKCAVHEFLFRYQSALLKVPTQLPPKVRAGPPSKRVKRVSWSYSGEESAARGGDPAVLAVGPARRALVYTRDELIRLRHSPLVRNNLENAFAGCDALALVLKKRSESPNEEDRGGKGDAPSDGKGVYTAPRERSGRSADPRERVRKESEPSGIVLSPQRRSFTSGCGAPAAPAPPPNVARTRPDSPLAAVAAPAAAHPPKQEPGARRIGSGRIMVRDDVREVPPANTRWTEPRTDGAEPYRPPAHQRLNGDRFERRSFGRDSYSSDIKRERDDRFNNEKTRDRDDNRRSGGRYSQRRFEKEDEPEWFSGGPTSQLETIELRGFDEPIKKNGNANNKETDDNADVPQKNGKSTSADKKKWNKGGSRSPAPERWRETSSPVPHHESPNTSNDKDSGVESKAEEPAGGCEQAEFNLDEFLKFDSIPEVLTNGGGESEGGSRFSQWFRRESPTNDRHYERLLHNMVDDLDNSTRQPSAAPEANVFAPISPARTHPPSLMDLLMRANEPAPEPAPATGKIHSLEELEARLRPQHPQHPPHSVPDHDLTAFRRLLAQVSGGHAVPAAPEPRPPPPPAPHHQPMTLLQMLNKSMEQQPQKPQQPHIPQELLYKLLQVQQRQQQQNELNAHLTPTDRDLLQRPEAQAILHGLKSGEITGTHLMQQLGNPGLQSRHREMLLTILRLHQHQRQMGGSPLPMGTAPHLVVPPHHQPLRLSPLPHQGGVPGRIPSPRELAVHTQSIMQNALIKKKLEEQRENYNRRRQEIHHQQAKQATPISFTPTSVLRKMTAEKEADSLSPKQQQWTQPPKMPQMGRPIVKGNQGGAPSMGYASQSEYQQHYMSQQQQMISGGRQYPQQSQRQPVNNSYNNMSNISAMGRGMPPNTTLHQLLAQSHQRSLNEMASVGAGGGDNQLARWFSPELLARASAGKLPSVHVPNALSLEDLERHHHSPAPPVRN